MENYLQITKGVLDYLEKWLHSYSCLKDEEKLIISCFLPIVEDRFGEVYVDLGEGFYISSTDSKIYTQENGVFIAIESVDNSTLELIRELSKKVIKKSKTWLEEPEMLIIQ